ncbi:unnamed protein product [Moneuplotes crassus]|uniref:Uncharacterized protein n=1 Tax=Euplotes crassus TaxID=5936 RepID=A0AAD2D5Y8_EUPCR|nr:unnamed protein product [Moneuplotes crassus]
MTSQTALDLLFVLKNETKKISNKTYHGEELRYLSECLYQEITEASAKGSNFCYLKLDALNINELNFKIILKLLDARPDFFKGMDLTNNPLFKENCLKKLFNLQKPNLLLEKFLAKQSTRYLTFLSFEKTGLKSEMILSSFMINVFYCCPDLEILILNSLPITDKVAINMARGMQKASVSKYKLAKNLKEIGLANTKISDKGAIGILFAAIQYTPLEVVNLEGNNKIGFNTASFILQQLMINPGQTNISLREVFLEYTKVSSSLRASLNDALDNYQEGNISMVNKISNKYNNSSSYRSQPRQYTAGSNNSSSRYNFKNEFWILNHDQEKESECTGTYRSKSAYNQSSGRDINEEELPIQLTDQSNAANKSLDRINNPCKINFRQSNYLFNSREGPNWKKNDAQKSTFHQAFESRKKSRKIYSTNNYNTYGIINHSSTNSSKNNRNMQCGSFSSNNFSIDSICGPSDPYEQLRRERSELLQKSGIYSSSKNSGSYEISNYLTSCKEETTLQEASSSNIPMQEFYDSKISRENLKNSSEPPKTTDLAKYISEPEEVQSRTIKDKNENKTPSFTESVIIEKREENKYANKEQSSSSEEDTFRSRQSNIENFVKQLNCDAVKDITESQREGKKLQKSFREFAQQQIKEFQDKENRGAQNNRNDFFNPYKRPNNSQNKKALESIDLNLKNFESNKDNDVSINENLDSPNRSAIIDHNHIKHTSMSQEEKDEDDEVRQMLREAGMTFNTNESQKESKKKLKREESIISNKILSKVNNHNNHNNSSLCLYGTESESKAPSGYKLNISNVQNYEEDQQNVKEYQLEKIGETEREHYSPRENPREDIKQASSILRQSHFQDIDDSSLQETKEMVKKEISRLREIYRKLNTLNKSKESGNASLFTINHDSSTGCKHERLNSHISIRKSDETISIIQDENEYISQRYGPKQCSDEDFNLCEIPDEGRQHL